MMVRQFNPSGVAAFKTFLREARLNPHLPVPQHLLEDDALTEKLAAKMVVEPQHFGTRREAADYLTRLLAPLPDDDVKQSAGLWTWLTLFFFDEVCPVRGGRRSVKRDCCYVFEPKNPRNSCRHLLFIAWYLARVARPHDRLFMNAPLSSLDAVTENVMGRLYLTRIPCIFEVLDRLYWDEARGKARAGIVSAEKVNSGDLMHRFPIRIRQLEKTYDLVSLTADQLLELLGDEFQQLK